MKTGKNVIINPTVQIFNPDMIEIGDNVRIDAFCVLSGGMGLKIGSHIHIACGGYFFAGAGIEIEDFVEIAPRLTVLSNCDDFHGHSLVGPCIPMKFKPDLISGKVIMKRHVLTGVNVTILPGITLGEGVAVGIGAMVNRDCEPWSIYAGVPAKKIKDRNKDMLILEKQFLSEYGGS